jgi:NAD(P)-dependent dehydrogenase (short-subunit alcohol dehydrogenase family)
VEHEQKVAIVTGASQGIGACLVAGFRARGYAVVANSRSITSRDFGADPAIVAVDGDIALASTGARIVDVAMAQFGRIDTLVNNAGIFIPKPFTDCAEAEFANIVAVNLAGFFHLTRQTVPWMLRAGSGHIVTITASVAWQPMASVPAALTAITKGGLEAATRSLAIEYSGRCIGVNAVSPGVIETTMHRPEAHSFLAGLQPMGRMGRTQEVADAVLYLEAASFVTGEILHVDGGAHAGRG